MIFFRLKPWHFKADTTLHVRLIKSYSFDIDLRCKSQMQKSLFRTNFTFLVESSPDFLNVQLAIQEDWTFANKRTFIWHSNNGFSGLSLQRNLNESTSFGSTVTWWNTFSVSPIIPFFPFLNFVMTGTKLFNKSVPRKRLSFKHVLLILAKETDTIGLAYI